MVGEEDSVVVEGVMRAGSGGGAGGGGAGVYLTGDSLERKSCRLGSRSRRGSLSDLGGSGLPQSQPMVAWFGEQVVADGAEAGQRVECQEICRAIM